MVDQSKRKTIKIISGASASALYSVSAFGSNNFSEAITTNGKPIANRKTDAHGSFRIEIIAGNSVPEDTVIFINETGADILIKQFLPGLITQNEQMINLNSLLLNGDIILKNGYPFTSSVAKWEPLSLDPDHSYLWCDSAVSKLPNSDTGIITLDAVDNNGRVLLTAKHDDILLS